MESTQQSLSEWCSANGYDANQWTPELLASLKKRWRSEQAIRPDHRLVVDLRWSQWPVRCYRVQEETL